MRVSASQGWYELTRLTHRICLGQNLIHIWLIITGIVKPEICLTYLHFFTFDQSGLFGGNSCLPGNMKSITMSLSPRIHIIFCSLIAHCSEKAMAPHSSTLAWKIPWLEEPGRLQSTGLLRIQTWLSDFTFTFHFHALEKEMATHSSILAWRIPGIGEPGGLPSMGSHRVGHDWSDSSSSSSSLLVSIRCST